MQLKLGPISPRRTMITSTASGLQQNGLGVAMAQSKKFCSETLRELYINKFSQTSKNFVEEEFVHKETRK